MKQFTLEDAEQMWEVTITRVEMGASLQVKARNLAGPQVLLIGMPWKEMRLIGEAIEALVSDAEAMMEKD